MKSEELALLLVRAACFLAAGVFILWPLVASGRVSFLALVLAAPFVLAGIAPRALGPLIGKGIMIIATLVAFYEPPSSIGFFPDRLAFALPFVALALMLAVPALPQALASMAVKE